MQKSNSQSFHKYRRLICLGCGRQVDIPIYCHNRFCPICGKPRMLRIRRKLTKFLKIYALPQKHAFRMITLSVPNTDDLPGGIDFLLKSFRRLRQRAYWKTVVDGGAFVIEIKGNPGNWHPHLHILVSSRYLSWNILHKQWNHVSGGLSVYISNLPAKRVVNYMLKYITKPSVIDANLDHVSNALINKRLFQPFGSFHSQFSKIPKDKYLCPRCGHNCLEPYGTIEPWHSEITKPYDSPEPSKKQSLPELQLE